MKLNGTHKFKVSSNKVFSAILDTKVLQSCIPGCKSVEYIDAHQIKADLTTPLPGLKGPYGVIIRIEQQQEPNHLVLRTQTKGTGGSIDAVSQIDITDELDGALLSYKASADLDGPIAVANNPIGEGITKTSLGAFFKNLDKAIVS